MGQLIEHHAVVRRIDGDRMTVRVNISGCESCGHGSGCAINRLTRRQEDATVMELPALAGLTPGDVVTLSLPESRMGIYALLAYLFPALSFLTGALLGSQLAGSDAATAMGALLGLASGFAISRLIFPRIPSLQPEAHIAVQAEAPKPPTQLTNLSLPRRSA